MGLLLACGSAKEEGPEDGSFGPSTDGASEDATGDSAADGPTDGGDDATTEGTDAEATAGDTGSPGESDVDQEDGWTTDAVELLVYRIDFANAPLEYTDAELTADLDAMVAYYGEQSYGRFTVTYSIHPEIFHAPNPVEDYADWYSYVDFYEASIMSTGVDPAAPGDGVRIMVTSPQVGNFNSSGGPPLMTVFHEGAGTIAHELGHTLGLRHSKSIEAGNEVIGVGDYETEALDYGNVYCMMGMGAHSLEEYNLMYKSYFGWLEPEEVPRVTTSGTYRIHAFDQGEGSGEPMGLTLHSGDGQYVYWVEYRVGGPYDTGEGVLLNLENYFMNEAQAEYWENTSYLLDMTPGSLSDENWWADDLTDAELRVGSTFEDPWGGFALTPVVTSTGETGADRWIELEITVN